MVKRHQTSHAAVRHRVCSARAAVTLSPLLAFGLWGWVAGPVRPVWAQLGDMSAVPCTRQGSAHCCSQSLPRGWAKGPAESLGDFLPVQGMRKKKAFIFFFTYLHYFFPPATRSAGWWLSVSPCLAAAAGSGMALLPLRGRGAVTSSLPAA